MDGKFYYEVDRVITEEYRDYFEKNRHDIDYAALTIESFDLKGAEVRGDFPCKQITSALGSGVHTINAVLVATANYETARGNYFTVITKWDFTNNKQLFHDDFAEMMFRDLETYLMEHFAEKMEIEE